MPLGTAFYRLIAFFVVTYSVNHEGLLRTHCLGTNHAQVDPRMNRTVLDPFPSQPVIKHDVKFPPVLNRDAGIVMVLDEVSRHGHSLFVNRERLGGRIFA